MEIEKIKAASRDTTGKGAARRLRQSGMVPAILYGFETDPVMIKVKAHDLKMILRELEGTNPFFKIVGEDEETKKLEGGLVVLKELQINPLTHEYQHIDFHKINMDVELTVEVPIHVVGKAEGVKMGGILQEIRRHLDISALPKDIPESIEIDVSELNVGDSTHLNDIQLPQGCQTEMSVNYTIVTVIAPRLHEEEVEEEELTEEELAEAAAEEGAEEGASEDGEESE
jgi:large subunit ribosomal protein L25